MSMMSCTECNYKFTFYDRLKNCFSFSGYLKCPKCNSVYEHKHNIYEVIYYI